MREKYESLSVAVLKELAKSRGLKNISALKKSQVIELMLAEDEKNGAVNDAAQNTEGASATIEEPKKAAPSQKAEYVQRAESPQRAENTQKTDHTQRTDNTQRAENMQRTDNTQRTENVQRTDNTQRTENVQRTDNTQRFENVQRTDNTQRTENVQRSDNTQRFENVQRTDNTQRTENVQRTDNTQRAESMQRTDSVLRTDNNPGEGKSTDMSQLDSGITANGILEVLPDGYGFIRCANYLPGENDVYVSPSQIRRFNLKTGDIITGNTRVKTQQEKFSALLYLKSINGFHPSEATKRLNFEDMTPIFPNKRMRMERTTKGTAMRIVDLISPIGKGQRGMIVSPPKAGKTTLLKDVAKSILQNNPDMHLIILLIDERPEEVTDIKEAICGSNVEVIYSTFDELPEHHKRVSEMVMERAKRLVEHRKEVTILLDSITRLARAYNLTVPPSGRTLSGGLDPAALHMPKRFFGAARNMREGGSLTILATALVDTGSKMDDVVYEEFKGTGNMELVLDRKLSERRVFPAIDIPKSGTRREDLLLDQEEQEAVYIMRKALNGMKSDDAVENILNMFVRTRNNQEFVQMVKKQKFI
ncbi:transcription termination factor Rho [uncultured Robinsoniella sp.]|uniref:transcription termination factor Rho n=1 Tax=uncultured Robinsoniella sp. TaxID=904190 RepID=UPI00374E269D